MIFVYAISIFFIEILLYLDSDNLFLVHFLTVVETIAFTSFLHIQTCKKIVKRLVLSIGLLFAFMTLLLSIFSENMKLIDSIQIGIETIIILVFSFYYLYERMNDTTTLYIYSNFHFWVILGVVLYLSGSFFIYIFADSLPKNEVEKYWVVTNILSIIKNIFFAIAIVVNSKPPKSFPPSEFGLSSFH